MKKILLAGQNKYWGTLERATEFWLKLGIKHVMIKWTKDTKFVENGRVQKKEFERFQKLQEEYGTQYHFHPYNLRLGENAISPSLKKYHSILKKLLINLDEQIHQRGLYPLITAHLPAFEKPKGNLKVDKHVALKNGKIFFQDLQLKSRLALEIMHSPYRNQNSPDVALLGYKPEHFRKIIGIKNYGLCIDVGHLNMTKEPLEKFLELPYPIFSVHLHGNDEIRDSHHMADKTNIRNFELVKKMLRKVEGPIVLEIRNYNYSIDDFRRSLELWELEQ